MTSTFPFFTALFFLLGTAFITFGLDAWKYLFHDLLQALVTGDSSVRFCCVITLLVYWLHRAVVNCRMLISDAFSQDCELSLFFFLEVFHIWVCVTWLLWGMNLGRPTPFDMYFLNVRNILLLAVISFLWWLGSTAVEIFCHPCIGIEISCYCWFFEQRKIICSAATTLSWVSES